MICPLALTCSIGNDGCFHAKFHDMKADCLIEFDKCPSCVDGDRPVLEIFLSEEEMIL